MTIAGQEVGAMALPEEDGRRLNRSVGITASGSVKIKKFRDEDRDILIVLKAKTTSVKDALFTAMAAAQTTTMSVDPDAHVDLGGGAGVAVNAYWIDDAYNATKDSHDAWTITLRFRKA